MRSIFDPEKTWRRDVLDRIGATGSLLCAVHCAALPLVLVAVPAIGTGLASHAFEVGFVAFASLLGMASLLLGYRAHRAGRALALLAPGIALLWCGVALDALHASRGWHALAMATGGSLVACAHWVNLRLSAHRCAHGLAEVCTGSGP
ncbi:MAG: MerC domain-containing protein [Proteobacteria bacterium]|nr:MerC domain-containing protein [Pseudomonadota bacterium]